MAIEAVGAPDIRRAAVLAARLWPDHDADDLQAELLSSLTSGRAALFLDSQSGRDIGFAFVSLRCEYVEGTDSSPVGYLEGIYVDPDLRKQGRASALLAACQSWAKARGCVQFASDVEFGNDASLRFHLSAGFREAGLIICLVKDL